MELFIRKNYFIPILFCLFLPPSVFGQISGTVFADYNASGTRTTATPSEPLVSGVIVTAYNAAGTILASYTTTQGTATSGSYPYTAPNFSIPVSGTAYNGTLGSNTGFVPATTAVRLEFTLSATGCPADNSYYSGQGSSSVQFITAPNSTVTYGINNPADYNTGTAGVSLFTPCYIAGDPLAGGTAGTSDWFVGYPYTLTSVTQHTTGAQLGAVWGVAYSKQAQKVFTSAFLKRHSGYGPLGSGGIYLLTPTASSFTVASFFDMDNNTFNTSSNPVTRTRADATAPAYGNGSSFTLSNTNQAVTYNGSTDPVSGFPSGLGVIGTNTQRGLQANIGTTSYDGAAFDQIGKVGLGGIDISDDGKYLFVMNLYQRTLFRLELNDAYNPTSVVSVTSYALPAQSCTNGVLRPFGVKYYRGKVYAGAVCTGETQSTNANTNLAAYIFELTNATGAATFNATAVLSAPLTYNKGVVNNLYGSGNRWYPWVNDLSKTLQSLPGVWLAQPMLSDIEFTERGDVIMGFMDRIAHQVGWFNYYYLGGTLTNTAYTETGGDILIAGKNCPSGFNLENNRIYTSNGVTYTASTTANGQGPGGGEFFYNEIYSNAGGLTHQETSLGSMAVLPGTKTVQVNVFDPMSGSSAGTANFSTTNGSWLSAFMIYQTPGSGNGTFGKANGLGDVEIALPLAPLEIGNRVWLDTDKDGVQDAGENGIASVTIELYADFNNDGTPDGVTLATTQTAADGTWYFNTTNVTDGDPSVAGNQAGPQPNKRYLIRIGSADWTSATGIGTGDLANMALTTANVGGSGQSDVRDNDGSILSGIPTISYLTGAEGQNDHTLDFGFTPLSIGDYIWFDNNKDGIQDINENGVKGLQVRLYPNGTCTGATYTTKQTTEFGLYEFTGLTSGTYCVQVTAPTDWSVSPAGVGSDPTRNSKGQTTTTAGVYRIQNIVLNNTNDYNQDIGLYSNCAPVDLTVGTTATLNQSVAYSHSNTYDIEIGNLKGTGYCAEKPNSDPINGDQLTVNTTDRNGVTVARQGYISRALAALGDPSVLSVVLSNFGAGSSSASSALDDVMQYIVWYYTNWNENFSIGETDINAKTWTATQKSAMIALAYTIINRAQGLNGETQYPIVQTYYLYNQTNTGRQDLIIPVGSLLPLSACVCPTVTNPSTAQTLCAGATGTDITVNTDYNTGNGIRFVKFTSDQMVGSSPTAGEATTIYAGTATATVTPTGASSPYTATYTWNSADFPNATSSPVTYYVYAILNPDLGASCRPVQEIQITVNPIPSTPSVTTPVMNPCPATTVNLNNISTALTPSVSSGTFEWHVSNSSSSALVGTVTAVGNGTYYLFEKSPSNCYSAGTVLQVQIQNCCPSPLCIPITITRSH